VLNYIDIGVAEGAKISAQAELPAEPELAGGYYVAPTVFDGVSPDMRIAQEEIFGPVTVVMTFTTDDEAVSINNGTQFGLIGAVFSSNTARAISIAQRLDQGMVLINNYNRMLIGSPFGGTKASGFGREHSPELTLEEYGYTKLLRIPSGSAPVPQWQAIAGIVQ